MSAVTGKTKPKSGATSGRFMHLLIAAVYVFIVITATPKSIAAQIPDAPLPVDPRSLAQLISDSEKSMLAEANSPKKQVDAYLKISDTHLQSAFNAIKVNNHQAAEHELDIYNKAVAAACKQAFAVQDGKRSLSKRIEQALYKQIKTLETIERLFPSEREVFAEAALKQSKQLRVQALNEAFASGEVLKDPEEEKKPKSEPPVKDDFATTKSPTTTGPFLRPVGSRLSNHRMSYVLRPLISTASSDVAFPRTPGLSLEHSRAFPRGIAINSVAGAGVDSTQMRGDYLTEEEDERVREAQAADARAKVFMKIADRRLKAIVGPAPAPTDKRDQKKIEEEEREWGAVPKVSRVELLRHYARAVSECMAKLEDAYERNPKSSALPKALTVLREVTDRHLQSLQVLKAEMKTEAEIAAISGAIYEAETANKGARDGLK